MRRNNDKVNSIDTERIVIAHLLPRSDLEKCTYTTIFFINEDKILSSLPNF